MEDSIKHIVLALKTARLQKKLSQRALSAKTGIPQNHISRIENGEVHLQTSSLIELARALELELLLVPRGLVPTFQALLSGSLQKGQKQTPKYQLEQENE